MIIAELVLEIGHDCLLPSKKQDKENGDPLNHGLIVNRYGCIVNCMTYQELRQLFKDKRADFIAAFLIELCEKTLYKVRYYNLSLEEWIDLFPFVTWYNADIAQQMMMEVLANKNTKHLEILLKNGIDCHRCIENIHKDYTCKFNGNYLHQAVCKNNPEAVALLMGYDVDCLWRDQQGDTPMEYAVREKKDVCITQLNKCITEKCVLKLCAKKYKEGKKLLLQITNCNMNAGTHLTLLHTIIESLNGRQRDKCIMILKDKGANFDICNQNDDTPLWYTLNLFNPKEIWEILLNCGADVNKGTTSFGDSLLKIALIRKNIELIKLCLRYGALVTEDMFKILKPKHGHIIELLQAAYNEQERARKKLQEIEEENKAVMNSCIICLDSPQNMKNVPCKAHHPETLICDDCCKELYDTKPLCPVCRGKLLYRG